MPVIGTMNEHSDFFLIQIFLCMDSAVNACVRMWNVDRSKQEDLFFFFFIMTVLICDP